MNVIEALHKRKSIRAYRPDPVPRATLERILAAAARAPSGNNIQPWKVRVLTGNRLATLTRAVTDFRATHPGTENWAYDYYPATWREPYLTRRRKVGWDMYGLLGITRADKDRIRAQHDANFTFFGAPVGIIVTLDRDLSRGSWVDCGMFLQSLALAATGEGLGCCLQAAWVAHADLVGEVLALEEGEMVVCGMALGWADASAVINGLESEREPLASFVTFLDD